MMIYKVSSIDSPTYNLAKMITKILMPLVGASSHCVQNSTNFVQLLHNSYLQHNDVMVSFDVVSLFTMVPVAEAVDIILGRLHKDSGLKERTDLTPNIIIDFLKKCLTTTYFQYQDKFYKQREGAAMGSPLSPLIAYIFMEFFEELAIETAKDKPSLWLRFVDDTFVRWRHGEENPRSFFGHLNSIRSTIQFTREKEERGQLPFLDVLVRKDTLSQQFHFSLFR